jgi:FKBP-type peptidyl-prolyl cis-trans isomerase (trigger factor)
LRKVSADVSDAAIDKTIDILHASSRTFMTSADAPAQDTDHATIDFRKEDRRQETLLANRGRLSVHHRRCPDAQEFEDAVHAGNMKW